MKQVIAVLIIIPVMLFPKTLRIFVNTLSNNGPAQFSWVGSGVSSSVLNDFAKINGIEVISEEERNRVLKEMEFQLSGMVDADKAAKAGKALGANTIFSGEFAVINNNVRITARLTGIEEARILSASKLDGKVDDLFKLQDALAVTLIKNIDKKTSTVTVPEITPVIEIAVAQERIPGNAYEFYAKGLEVKPTNAVRALYYFEEALKRDKNCKEAMLEAAKAAVAISKFDAAGGYVKAAYDLYRTGGDDASLASVYNTAGMIYTRLRQYPDALTCYQNAKAIREKLSLTGTMAHADVLMNIGALYTEQNDAENALRWYDESQRLKTGLGMADTPDFANLLMNRGVVYARTKQYDKASVELAAAQKIYEKLSIEFTPSYAALLMNIGGVAMERGELDAARDAFLTSGHIREKMQLEKTLGYAMVMHNLGDLSMKKKESAAAVSYYQKALALYTAFGITKKQDEVKQRLAELKN
ncbi:MAG: tetratricopeptide repeat protein [Spirochaetes bacterium]|nr:tetratricopeptide repeat protein [Spirochaetota bacterium]